MKKIIQLLIMVLVVCGGASYVYASEEVLVADAVTTSGAIVVEKDFEFNTSSGRITRYVGNDEIVTIPEKIAGITVEKIGANVFSGNKVIKEVIIPETIKEIGEDGLGNLDSYPFLGTENLEKIIVNENNTLFYSKDGVLFDNEDTLLWYPQNKNDRDYVVPAEVKAINKFGFYNCNNLENIYFAYADVHLNTWSIYYNDKLTVYCFENTSVDSYAKNNVLKTEYLQTGDINCDGVVDANDSITVLQWVLNSDAVEIKLPVLCDVDMVDGITAADSAMILQKALNNSYKF